MEVLQPGPAAEKWRGIALALSEAFLIACCPKRGDPYELLPPARLIAMERTWSEHHYGPGNVWGDCQGPSAVADQEQLSVRVQLKGFKKVKTTLTSMQAWMAGFLFWNFPVGEQLFCACCLRATIHTSTPHLPRDGKVAGIFCRCLWHRLKGKGRKMNYGERSRRWPTWLHPLLPGIGGRKVQG